MEPVLHISEAELARDVRSVLERVAAGAEVIIERDQRPVAVLRASVPKNRKVSECIALAEAHEKDGTAPEFEPDFADDLSEVIGNRRPWNPPDWD